MLYTKLSRYEPFGDSLLVEQTASFILKTLTIFDNPPLLQYVKTKEAGRVMEQIPFNKVFLIYLQAESAFITKYLFEFYIYRFLHH